jgi:predicted nucleotidyltransferase
VPAIVDDLVANFEPLQVILYGSVARGDDGPDSDIDLLVVLPEVDAVRRHEVMAAMRRAISVPLSIETFPTDPREIERRRDVIGSMHYWPLREGKVVYERAA